MRGPQNSCRTLPPPKISPLGPKKVQYDQKIKSKSNVRLETKKMKVAQVHD